MAWRQLETDSGSGAGQFESQIVYLEPHELCHYQVQRGPGSGTTDRMAIDIETSPDGTTWDTVPYERYLVGPTNSHKSFLIGGIYAFRVVISNGEGAPGDTFAVTFRWRRNGVSL